MRSMLAMVLAASLSWGTASAAERRFVLEEGPLSATLVASQLQDPDLSPRAIAGARQLQMNPRFVQYARDGLELLYKRRYRDTRAYFSELEQVFPGTAVSSIADVLVWQAVMLENFDYRHDAQYKAASEAARSKLQAALEQPGAEAWEHFMLAGTVGIEAIHAARQGRYLPALTLAFKAIDHVETVRDVAPDFADLKLADGLYNYWRSVITGKSKALPDFGDKRTVGITQIEAVEDEGIFLGPPATLAMAFTWLEERKYDAAIDACQKNQRRYPDNVINELMLGISQLYKRSYDAALATFDHILATDPKNKRVRYYKGLTHDRAGRPEAAVAEFETYLGSDYLEDYQRAAAHYRLGRVYEDMDRYDDAEAQYKQAIKVDGYDRAKAALDKLKKARKAGTLD